MEGGWVDPGGRWAGAQRVLAFVLPNPSGRNRTYPGFEAKLAWFRDLADLVDGS